jgi:hypothetical protein
MEQILKALKALPKEYLQVIILELMKDQKIFYEDITKAYVQYLDMLRKGQSEAYLELQSKVVTMWSGTKKPLPYQKNRKRYGWGLKQRLCQLKNELKDLLNE